MGFVEFLRFQKRRMLWRLRNRHNGTYLVRNIPLECVHVGCHSYGPVEAFTFGNPEERLTIGHFVSIAQGVSFLLGGEHRLDALTTFPSRVLFGGEPYEAIAKGPIVIGDDVWIGHRATILSGVTVGRGAVIGAGSVVAKSLPPYSISVGCPAKVIRSRFSPDIIESLLKLDFDVLAMLPKSEFADLNIESVTGFSLDAIVEKVNRFRHGE